MKKLVHSNDLCRQVLCDTIAIWLNVKYVANQFRIGANTVRDYAMSLPYRRECLALAIPCGVADQSNVNAQSVIGNSGWIQGDLKEKMAGHIVPIGVSTILSGGRIVRTGGEMPSDTMEFIIG